MNDSLWVSRSILRIYAPLPRKAQGIFANLGDRIAVLAGSDPHTGQGNPIASYFGHPLPIPSRDLNIWDIRPARCWEQFRPKNSLLDFPRRPLWQFTRNYAQQGWQLVSGDSFSEVCPELINGEACSRDLGLHLLGIKENCCSNPLTKLVVLDTDHRSFSNVG